MSLFSPEIVLDGTLSTAEARLKWEKETESGARQAKVKGKALFLHSLAPEKPAKSSKEGGRYVLHYYSNYGGDFCDAVFSGEIFEYEDTRSQILGKVTVSRSMKRFSIILFVLALPLAVLFDMMVYFGKPRLYEAMPSMRSILNYIDSSILTIFIATSVTVAAGIMCLIVDKRKVKEIMDYLNDFLKEDVTENPRNSRNPRNTKNRRKDFI
ncbi:MAG: hypothetical protein FWG83_08265 [Oscillospiraceae bacterium]|nr:hypothetical protein [Oscillospiraceae bacterium]